MKKKSCMMDKMDVVFDVARQYLLKKIVSKSKQTQTSVMHKMNMYYVYHFIGFRYD